jgi:hypothetical protein
MENDICKTSGTHRRKRKAYKELDGKYPLRKRSVDVNWTELHVGDLVIIVIRLNKNVTTL